MVTTAKKIRPPPKTQAELRPVDKAFIHSIMFKLGILPIEDPMFDMRVPLRTLSSDDARVIKRKFRKLWRKYLKVDNRKSGTDSTVADRRLGLGKRMPSRAERLARKRLVYDQVWYECIVPLLQRFETPTRKDIVPGSDG